MAVVGTSMRFCYTHKGYTLWQKGDSYVWYIYENHILRGTITYRNDQNRPYILLLANTLPIKDKFHITTTFHRKNTEAFYYCRNAYSGKQFIWKVIKIQL